jgi:uncharacterized protein (DUF2147 family)
MIVAGAAKAGANEWKGKLLNPEDGKTYSGVITLVGEWAQPERVRARVFCQGETWRRVK